MTVRAPRSVRIVGDLSALPESASGPAHLVWWGNTGFMLIEGTGFALAAAAYLSPSALALLGRFPLMVYMHDYFWPCPNGAYYDFRQQAPCDRQPLGLRCLAADCDRTGRPVKLGRLARHIAQRTMTRRHGPARVFLHCSEAAFRTAAPLLPRERHATIHNWMEVGPQPPPPPLEPRFDFGYFGRIEPEKGIASLLQTAEQLNLCGLFVGEGSLGPMIAASTGQTHRRWQPRDTIAAAMRACRVVVLPSLWPETWGLVIPEAMAAGVPVLVSSRAGTEELVRHFGGGAIFDPACDGHLAAQLTMLLREGRPVESCAWPQFARFLSSARHAETLVRLAADTFGIDLSAASVRSLPPAVSGYRPIELRPIAT